MGEISLQKIVLAIANKIRRLEIQGARNIAIAAIKAIEEGTRVSKVKRRTELIEELLEAKEVLFSSRATEPLMRNAIRYIICTIESAQKKSIDELIAFVSSVSNHFLDNLELSKERIALVGSKRISNNSKILTHCHSSTVINILLKAKLAGKSFDVICTESRPVFQGRITAKELVEAGIDTTMIVDSAVRYFVNNVDLVIVGADAITSEGNVINKIGTSMVALAAKEARTPFYVASELLKFDPATFYGDYEIIEERNAEEVWNGPPLNLKIRNPAFDITRRDFIHGIISEEGIIPPNMVSELVGRKHSWIFKKI